MFFSGTYDINNHNMDKDELKKKIKEIAEIIKVCPPNLREKCFEVLLQAELSAGRPTSSHGAEEPQKLDRELINSTSSFAPPEISKRIKAFSAQFQLTEAMVQKSYAVDDSGNVSIEVTDLKTKKTSQQQRRLALLIGVRHQFAEGSFDIPMEELRELCVTYGVYDAANFKANIKNSSDIFAGKSGNTNKLSPKGKKEAAELIKELAV